MSRREDWWQFLRGYAKYLRTGRTDEPAYFALRHLAASTNGRLNRAVGRAYGWTRPVQRRPAPSGVLGSFSAAQIRAIAKTLRREGYAVLDRRLPADMCEEMRAHAERVPAIPTPAAEDGKDAVYDPDAPRATRYWLRETDVVACPAVQRLLADDTFLTLAEAYLRASATLDLVAMWWLTPYAAGVESESALMYHADMDRPVFVKFFVYLTDVTADTGPHCYVPGSHRSKPAALRRDGRFEDAEVAAAYGRDPTVQLTGPAGTVIMGDTSAFHKGLPLRTGDRLMFQLEFSLTEFGATRSPVPLGPDTDPALLKAVARWPQAFRRFQLPED